MTATISAILPRKKHRNLAQGVVERITADIGGGVLKPGDKLPTESAIMALHGVARGKLTVDADVQFHQVIAQATGNRYVVDILSQLGRAIIPRARVDTPRLGQDDPGAYLERVNREHEDIITRS